jgi:hypothetical protein
MDGGGGEWRNTPLLPPLPYLLADCWTKYLKDDVTVCFGPLGYFHHEYIRPDAFGMMMLGMLEHMGVTRQPVTLSGHVVGANHFPPVPHFTCRWSAGGLENSLCKDYSFKSVR